MVRQEWLELIKQNNLKYESVSRIKYEWNVYQHKDRQ